MLHTCVGRVQECISDSFSQGVRECFRVSTCITSWFMTKGMHILTRQSDLREDGEEEGHDEVAPSLISVFNNNTKTQTLEL